MNSSLNRANTIFFHSVSVLATLCFLNWITSFNYSYSIEVSRLDAPKVEGMGQVMLYPMQRKVEATRLLLTGDVNVSGVFNWNTLQVFVYVQADVTTRSGRRFRQVVWDRVVNRTDGKAVKLRDEPAEYLITMTDPGDTLAGAAVALSFAWDVMPISGGLRRDKGPQDGVVSGIRLPDQPCMSVRQCRKLVGALPRASALAMAAAGPDEPVAEPAEAPKPGKGGKTEL